MTEPIARLLPLKTPVAARALGVTYEAEQSPAAAKTAAEMKIDIVAHGLAFQYLPVPNQDG